LTDAEAIQNASVYKRVATDHWAALQAFDPSFDATFATDWQLAIDAAISIPTDESTVDLLAGFTKTVADRTEECIDAVRDLRYYAAKAFSKTSEEWAYLNLKGLSKARASSSKLAVYMFVLHRAATTLAAALTAVGMQPAQITALQSTAQNLLQADIDQEHHKHVRLGLTRQRVAKVNHLWSFCRQVNAASKTVFANDPTLLSLFELG
jgi:hypothetical protein